MLSGFFLLAALSSLALPGLLSFVGEFLVLVGTFQRYLWVGAIATLGIVITAAYVLRLYQRSMTGPLKPELDGLRDIGVRERVALAPIAALVIVLGLFPAPLLNVINPAVDRVMTSIGATDPSPTVVGAVGSGRGRCDVQPAQHQLLRDRPDPHRVRCRRRVGPDRGVRAAAGPSADPARAGHRLAACRARGRRRPAGYAPGHGRRRDRRRRSDADLVGHAAGRGTARRAAVRRADHRPAGRRVRAAGLDAPGLGGRAAVHPARVPADRDLAVLPVRPHRHARVPGGERPAAHLRRARGHVAAAVPARRHGTASTAAVAGGCAQVLPARRVLVGVLPVRRGDALRLQRVGRPGRHRGEDRRRSR